MSSSRAASIVLKSSVAHEGKLRGCDSLRAATPRSSPGSPANPPSESVRIAPTVWHGSSAGETHDLLEKTRTTHAAPAALRFGSGVHLSWLPEAFWREGKNHRRLPGHWLAVLRGLPGWLD